MNIFTVHTKYTLFLTYIRSKVDIVPLACEDDRWSDPPNLIAHNIGVGRGGGGWGGGGGGAGPPII